MVKAKQNNSIHDYYLSTVVDKNDEFVARLTILFETQRSGTRETT